MALLFSGLALVGQSENSAPRISSEVAWTAETLAFIEHGDAFRGLLVARSCNHCHGEEGFSSVPGTPNLAGLDDLSIWKQLEDFRSRKRDSPIMQRVVGGLSRQGMADLAAYFSSLPTLNDPQDNRVFPEPMPDASLASAAARLVIFGDAQRGIPPCQSCHGPVGLVKGAPSLATQNGTYLQTQLEKFAEGGRSNDINMRMRSIAKQMTAEERTAVAQFYGAGMGPGANPRQ